MKILLLGEYSNLHWTLARGLRKLGHEVVVTSDGNRYKNYNRDINLERKSYGLLDTFKYLISIFKTFRTFKGYDVVQLINPIFVDLKANRNLSLYRYLKKHNKKVFLGAFGTDYFLLKACLDKTTFRYSEYAIGDKLLNFSVAKSLINNWNARDKNRLNKEIVNSCNGIVACLYEYYASYAKEYPDKLGFVPEPIDVDEITFRQREIPSKVKFFIGIQTERSQIKGTDVLYKVLQKVQQKYPDECLIQRAESLPYDQYMRLMADSDVLLDQLYSYTPAMNALAAMAQGIVVVGGGEPESYEILNETENKPVINVLPDEDDIFNKLEHLILHKEEIPSLSLQSRMFVEKHHSYLKVAQQYVDFWMSK